MGDRGYEGDSGYLANLGSAAGADRWDAGRWDANRGDADRRDADPRDTDPWDDDRRAARSDAAERPAPYRSEADRWAAFRSNRARSDAERPDPDRPGTARPEPDAVRSDQGWPDADWPGAGWSGADWSDAVRSEAGWSATGWSDTSWPDAGGSGVDWPDTGRSDPGRPEVDWSDTSWSDPGRSETARWASERPDALPPQPASTDDAAAGVARRLQARLDRQLWLLERLQAGQLYPEPHELPELQDTALRMRRDSESLLLLCGQEPGVRATGPRPLDELIAEAAAAAEKQRRIDVRPGPAALVDGAAAVEFVHVLAELVDHVTTVYPGAEVELASRLELPADLGADGRGATVDVVVEGAVRYDPDGPGARAATAAEQLAQRSRNGIVLRRPPGGAPTTGSGLVASVHCPPAAVTPEKPVLPPTDQELPGRVEGTWLPQRNGSEPTAGLDGYGPEGGVRPTLAFDESAAPLSLLPHQPQPRSYESQSYGSQSYEPPEPLARSQSQPQQAPSPPSSASSSLPPPVQSPDVDELFGPLIDLPLEPFDDRYATPIFEAVASAWFQEGGGGEPGSEYRDPGGSGGPLDWETPNDDEWREAAARAARSEPAPTTAMGLPLRRPGSQLVPPPRTTGSQNNGPAERVPDRVRERLSTYQRGLEEGRHHSEGLEPGREPEDW